MGSVRPRRLVVSVLVFTAVFALPAPARAQACGQGLPALQAAEQAEQAARDAYVAAETQAMQQASPSATQAAVTQAEALGRAFDQARRKVAALANTPCIILRGGLAEDASLTTLGAQLDFVKTFSAFFTPQALQERTGSSAWMQTSGTGRHSGGGLTRLQLGLVGEVGFDHGDGATLLSFLGGIRVTVLQMSPKLAPFAQFLVGVEHCGLCQYSAFALQPGFGVNYALKPRLGLSAQLDFRLVPSSENEIRFSGGISIPIGK